MVINFDPTVGSRSDICKSFRRLFKAFDLTIGSPSNFYSSFRRLFFLGLLWNRYSVTRWCARPDLSNESKWP
jgi:hypothetical protein